MIEQPSKRWGNILIGQLSHQQQQKEQFSVLSSRRILLLLLLGVWITMEAWIVCVEGRGNRDGLEIPNINDVGSLALLKPGREIISESIKPTPFSSNLDQEKDGDVQYRIYKLIDMKPLTQYELRISYPAYTPALFSIEILSEKQFDGRVNWIKSPKHSRKLLNIEKVMFKLDREEFGNSLQIRYALVRAQVEAPSTFDNSNSLLYYNIGKFLS